MVPPEMLIGCSALLRVAGFPIRLWSAAGNPELFELLRQLDELEGQYRAVGAQLAERIGTQLVPNPALSSRERALTLRLRRRLHNGEELSQPMCKDVAALTARALGPSSELIEGLGTVERCSAQVIELERRAASAVDAEQARLLRTPWELIHSSPVAERALRGGNPQAYREIEQRVRRGHPWEGKRLRQSSDYLWRMIARGATKTTPRAWLGHIALLPVAQHARAAFPPAAVTADLAAHWLENIHGQRLELAGRALEQADPGVCLTIAPLHWHDDGHLQFWVVDPAEPTRMRDLRLRRTALLDAIREALQAGPVPLGQIGAALLPAPEERQLQVLRAFLGHLTGLGVLQASKPPRGRIDGWHPLPAAPPASPNDQTITIEVRDGDDEYVDVYRKAAAPLPYAACLHVQELVLQAVRVLALIDADKPEAERHTVPEEVTEEPRPVLALVAERLRADEDKPPETAQPRRHHQGWPAARTGGSGYARLLEWMAARAGGASVLDISPALLDQFGAPQQPLDWPLDCMLRVLSPGADPVAVLDRLNPAGVLDARFASGLGRLHGGVPHAGAYRAFLCQFEEEAGIPFVELLVPPLSDRAANAVRRPLYTRAWTGDADLSTYCQPENGSQPRYIPLGAITLRRRGDRLVAEADGRQIWPAYHATRSPLPPWNHLLRLLLGASPPRLPWARPLRCTLEALGDRNVMPRITVGGALVLSCAQWRITNDQLWDPDVALLAKARALTRLRCRLALPRWVFVASTPGGKPLACDLDSLRAVRTLERTATHASEAGMAMEEMLPTPDQLAVADHAHLPGDHLASELMLRLPCDEPATAMATRLARAAVRPARPAHVDTTKGGETHANNDTSSRVGASRH